MPESPRIAVTLPVHSEADSIEGTLRALGSWATPHPRTEIFVFEDGSTDGTKEILTRLAEEMPSVTVSMSHDRKGYPGAVRDAILSIPADRFDFILTSDSDGQYFFDDMDLLLEEMKRNDVDMVIGARPRRPEALYRKLPSLGLKVLEKAMFGIPLGDVTSALRLMTVESAQRVASRVAHTRYNFWLEFAARCAKMGIRQLQVRVRYRARKGKTKVYLPQRMPGVLLSEFAALLRTRNEYP